MLPATITYYIVGPEAIRLIDMDEFDSGVGSAFGQGSAAGGFNNVSLQASVFSIEANSIGQPYVAAGQFTTTATAVKPAVHREGIAVTNEFSGVADADEAGDLIEGGADEIPISGLYAINSNGYGSLSITSENLGDVAFLGMYMVDPTINVNDPNNPVGGGGALVVDLDDFLSGTGVLVPQTDPSSASFTGPYAFGAQVFNGGSDTATEVDFLGQGVVTDGALTGTGLLNDPGFTLAESSDGQYTGVTYSGTAVPSGDFPGRYTILLDSEDPFTVNFDDSSQQFTVVLYQASGGQLVWMEGDNFSLFGGPLQQQGSLSGIPQPAAKKGAAKTKAQTKKK